MPEKNNIDDFNKNSLYAIMAETEKLANVGGWEWDIKNDVWTFSDNWLKIHGCSDRHQKTADLLPIEHPDDRENIQTAFDKAVTQGSVYEIEHRIIRQDTGEERYIRAFGRPKLDDDGKVEKIFGSAQDITELKQAEEQLRRHHAMFSRTEKIANVGSWEWDVATDTVTWSDELYRIFKLDPCNGAPSWAEHPKFYHPDDFQKLHQAVEKALEKGTPYEVELRAIRTDGKIRHCVARGRAHTDSDGKVFQLAGSLQDITKRKKTETALKETNIELKLAQKIAKIGNWSLDPQVGIPVWSEMVYQIYERDSKLGPHPLADYSKIYRGKHWRRFQSAIQGAINEGIPYEIELKLELPSETVKWVRAICEPDPNKGPKGHFLRGTIQDITEYKQMEESLRQAQKMESIGKLAGGIAHDFNNILYPIIGFTQLSMDELPKGHSVQDNLTDILDGAKRARDLVKRILLFSRQQDQIFKPTLLKPVIEETLKLLRSSIPANVSINSRLSENETYVLCDETHIHEIVMNLCTNAYHALEEDGGEIQLDLEPAEPDADLNIPPGNYLCLRVTDNGSGIPQSHLEKVFDPYFTTKEIGKGSGLGLSVVHGIVKNYKGDIVIDSEYGKGTVVSVYLPVTDHKGYKPKAQERQELIAGSETILFVDDEKAIVKLGVRSLEKAGYNMTGEASSLGALERIDAAPQEFDLVITDMAMPELDGLQLAQKIYEINPDIPVLICSGYSEKLDKAITSKPNIKGKLDKPVTVENLLKKVRFILDQNRSENA